MVQRLRAAGLDEAEMMGASAVQPPAHGALMALHIADAGIDPQGIAFGSGMADQRRADQRQATSGSASLSLR